MSIAELGTADRQTLPPMESMPAEPSEIARTLRFDFFNTFRFSQGRVLLQNALSVELGNYYRSTWSADTLAQVPAALDIVQGKVGDMKVPGAHPYGNNYDKEFAKRFATFREALQPDPAHWPEIPAGNATERAQIVPQRADKRLELIANLSIDRDVEFIQKGRRYIKDEDPARSFTRDYILGLQTTRSVAYDDIFRRSHDQLVNHDARRRMELLQRVWEHKHPGQTFYSPEFLASEPRFMRRDRMSAFIGGLLPDSVLHMRRGGK